MTRQRMPDMVASTHGVATSASFSSAERSRESQDLPGIGSCIMLWLRCWRTTSMPSCSICVPRARCQIHLGTKPQALAGNKVSLHQFPTPFPSVMQNPLFKLLPAALAIALISPLANAQTAATVNGKPIPEAMLNTVAENMAKQSGQPVTPQLKDQIKKELILREVVVQEAEKQGLEKQKAVQDELQISRQNILIRTLFADYLKKHPITDAQIKAKYDQFAKSFGSTEYEAQHILVPTEKEAQGIIAQLKKGAKFGALAKKYSKDTASAANNGNLGWSTPSNYVEPFAAALMKLKPGEYTATPVQTQFGWHIIKLDKTRPAKPPALEQLKPQIIQELQREAVQKYQQELLAQAKVTQ